MVSKGFVEKGLVVLPAVADQNRESTTWRQNRRARISEESLVLAGAYRVRIHRYLNSHSSRDDEDSSELRQMRIAKAKLFRRYARNSDNLQDKANGYYDASGVFAEVGKRFFFARMKKQEAKCYKKLMRGTENYDAKADFAVWYTSAKDTAKANNVLSWALRRGWWE